LSIVGPGGSAGSVVSLCSNIPVVATTTSTTTTSSPNNCQTTQIALPMPGYYITYGTMTISGLPPGQNVRNDIGGTYGCNGNNRIQIPNSLPAIALGVNNQSTIYQLGFSRGVNNVTLVAGGGGLFDSICPESFTFTTNASILPTLIPVIGCGNIAGNVLTLGLDVTLNAGAQIFTVFSSVAFTQLNITAPITACAGTGFALCSVSSYATTTSTTTSTSSTTSGPPNCLTNSYAMPSALMQTLSYPDGLTITCTFAQNLRFTALPCLAACGGSIDSPINGVLLGDSGLLATDYRISFNRNLYSFTFVVGGGGNGASCPETYIFTTNASVLPVITQIAGCSVASGNSLTTGLGAFPQGGVFLLQSSLPFSSIKIIANAVDCGGSCFSYCSSSTVATTTTSTSSTSTSTTTSSTTTTSAPECTLLNFPFVNSSVTYSDLTISGSGSGDIQVYGTQGNVWRSCQYLLNLSITLKSILLGKNNSFIYTVTFSKLINNIKIGILGSYYGEAFTFTTDLGNPTLTDK